MPDILVPDGSQYQGPIAHGVLADYLRRTYGGAAAIFRLCYGDLAVDTLADRNIDGARAAPFDVLGWYLYLIKGRAVEPQADTFARILLAHGGLRRGEFVAVDDEESEGGDESGRVDAALARLDLQLKTADPGDQDWWYSDLNFAVLHNLAAAGGRRWIAAYGATEPTAIAHDLWQRTDAASLPGIAGPVDASVFHGTIAQLRALIGGEPMGIASACSDGDLYALHDMVQFYCFGPIDTSTNSKVSFAAALRGGTPMDSILNGWLTLPQSQAWRNAVSNLVAVEGQVAHLQTAGTPGVDPAALEQTLAKLAADQQQVLADLQAAAANPSL